MFPTIHPAGDVVFVERLSHRIYGLDGGSIGEVRAREARSRQKRLLSAKEEEDDDDD
eukprot:CAMPEP_0172492634 /NCGR_PEP_ID=MMETSP1066-20121228/23857_1 /TAXON_ID=671091 /ORGANISM="Coscinodiscus wailesii, Strain CCMP2513" /LENGTH=56 /DNA_ID=CAMNT_0013262377 /DNA_START=400 /DNA_END=567 /DNA_ORIENTATION=-